MHHTIQKKKSGLGEFGCARGPQVRVQFLFSWPCRVPWPSAPSSQRRALTGLSPSSYSPRPSALSPEISAFNHHACTLGSPPWGGRASKYRLRARGENVLLFIFLAMIWHTNHCQKNKKWPPANRLRALTPTHTSPPSSLKSMGAADRPLSTSR